MSRIARSLALSARRPLCLAVGAVILGAALGGCDDADRDAAERNKLQKAYAYRSAGDGERRYVALADEVAATQSTDATMALAHELVGDVSVELAGFIVSGQGQEDGVGLGSLQTRALVLTEHAHRLANTLAQSRAFIETEQQRDPQLLLQNVEQQTGAVRAGEGWLPGGDVQEQLPSLEQTQTRISQLNSRLEELNGQIAQLDQQRTQMLADASELDQQSDRETGQQSVDTYRKVADLRTEAAQVAASTERLQAQVRQATAEAQEAMALRDALEQTIALLEQEQEGMRAKWEGVQTQIQQIQQASQETYSAQASAEGANPLSSIELIAQDLGPALSRMTELGNEAASLLQKASGAYENARSRAGNAFNQSGPQFREAFGETFSSTRISLNRAAALRQLGAVQAATASVYAGVFGLQQTLSESGRDLPDAIQQALPASPQEAYTQAIDEAARALVEANEILSQLSSGGGARGPLGQSALTQRAVVLTGLWSLQALIETTGVPVSSDLPTQQQIAEQARELAAVAQTNRATLPAAAPFIGDATTQPATQPTTQPGEAPTTQPADGEAPGEEGEGEGAAGDEPAPQGGSPQ